MTVIQIDSTKCCAWSYVDERGETCWKVLVRYDQGHWLEVDEDGVCYDQTATGLRRFILDWIADAALDGDDPGPTPDTMEVYHLAAAFIEANS